MCNKPVLQVEWHRTTHMNDWGWGSMPNLFSLLLFLLSEKVLSSPLQGNKLQVKLVLCLQRWSSIWMESTNKVKEFLNSRACCNSSKSKTIVCIQTPESRECILKTLLAFIICLDISVIFGMQALCLLPSSLHSIIKASHCYSGNAGFK